MKKCSSIKQTLTTIFHAPLIKQTCYVKQRLSFHNILSDHWPARDLELLWGIYWGPDDHLVPFKVSWEGLSLPRSHPTGKRPTPHQPCRNTNRKMNNLPWPSLPVSSITYHPFWQKSLPLALLRASDVPSQQHNHEHLFFCVACVKHCPWPYTRTTQQYRWSLPCSINLRPNCLLIQGQATSPQDCCCCSLTV